MYASTTAQRNRERVQVLADELHREHNGRLSADLLITAAIDIANIPELERDVKEVFTGPTHSEIRCVDGTDWTFPPESRVPIVVASR